MRSSALCCLATFILSGCGGERSNTVTTLFRDSAGIVIAESPELSPSHLPPWALSPEPLTAIGSFDGPEESQLFRVRGALRLPDGRIAVGNSGTSEIRIFAPDGRFLHSFGGEGEGPGEFSYLALVGLRGDSLVAVDRSSTPPVRPLSRSSRS